MSSVLLSVTGSGLFLSLDGALKSICQRSADPGHQNWRQDNRKEGASRRSLAGVSAGEKQASYQQSGKHLSFFSALKTFKLFTFQTFSCSVDGEPPYQTQPHLSNGCSRCFPSLSQIRKLFPAPSYPLNLILKGKTQTQMYLNPPWGALMVSG